jgi:hypothetical protein
LTYFLHIYEYVTLKPTEAILRREREKRVKNGHNEPKQGTLYAYVEMSQQNILYKYYIPI